LDARSDLFSLGAVLYEMATGQRAFAGSSMPLIFDAILNRPVTPPLQLNPKLPPKLQQIIQRLLEKDRELRYQSAAELRGELKRLQRDTESPLPAKTVGRLWSGLGPPHPGTGIGSLERGWQSALRDCFPVELFQPAAYRYVGHSAVTGPQG